MTTTNYHYDIDEEAFKSGADAIVDYFDLQEKGMMQDFFTGIEDLMFGPGPSSSTQSPFRPFRCCGGLLPRTTVRRKTTPTKVSTVLNLLVGVRQV